MHCKMCLSFLNIEKPCSFFSLHSLWMKDSVFTTVPQASAKEIVNGISFDTAGGLRTAAMDTLLSLKAQGAL